MNTDISGLEVAVYILLEGRGIEPEITLERVHQAPPPTTEPDKWAIRGFGYCMGKSGRWSFEPQPSYRDDDWLEDHRFDSPEEALKVWDASMTKAGREAGR